jgi:hypothetical protein
MPIGSWHVSSQYLAPRTTVRGGVIPGGERVERMAGAPAGPTLLLARGTSQQGWRTIASMCTLCNDSCGLGRLCGGQADMSPGHGIFGVAGHCAIQSAAAQRQQVVANDRQHSGASTVTRDEWIQAFVTAVVDARVGFSGFRPTYLQAVAQQRWSIDQMRDPKDAALAWIVARSVHAQPPRNSTMKGRA